MFRKGDSKRYTEEELVEKAKKDAAYEGQNFDAKLIELSFLSTGLQPKRVGDQYELVAAGY